MTPRWSVRSTASRFGAREAWLTYIAANQDHRREFLTEEEAKRIAARLSLNTRNRNVRYHAKEIKP